MGELIKWKPNLDVTRRIDQALEFISGSTPVLQAPCPPPRLLTRGMSVARKARLRLSRCLGFAL